SGSEWVRFSPPRPAIRNLRATEGIRSCTMTRRPACARRSAAISPAGPAPITATVEGERVIDAFLAGMAVVAYAGGHERRLYTGRRSGSHCGGPAGPADLAPSHPRHAAGVGPDRGRA